MMEQSGETLAARIGRRVRELVEHKPPYKIAVILDNKTENGRTESGRNSVRFKIEKVLKRIAILSTDQQYETLKQALFG